MKGAKVTLSVPDGTYRSWRTLWRSRPRVRVLFIGTVTNGNLTRNLNSPSRLSVTAVDALADLMDRPA